MTKFNGIIPGRTEDLHVFTLPAAPNPADTMLLFRNGVLQEPGEEYVLDTNLIRYQFDVGPDDRQRAWYEAE